MARNPRPLRDYKPLSPTDEMVDQMRCVAAATVNLIEVWSLLYDCNRGVVVNGILTGLCAMAQRENADEAMKFTLGQFVDSLKVGKQFYDGIGKTEGSA